MNTIRVYLAESGRVADLKKDFPLYQGQFQNKLLNIYVPTSILSPEIKTIIPGQETGQYAAGTAVKIGMTHLTRNGEIKKSKNYYMRYLKTLTYQNVEYAMFERKLPQEFTLYAGYGSNAPVLIINVVNVETDVDPDEVLSIITSQTCSFDVLESSRLDNDEPVEPSELETINARLNSIDKVLPTKQDKTDEGLNTENKTVVGAINGLKEDVGINTANITQNTEDIAKNTNDIDYLKQHISQPEEYIGQMTGTTLPTNQQLNDFVMGKVGREPKNADVVIFILQIPNATDKNYKYIYSVDGWNGYEIPSMEQASNGTFGIVEGTYNIGSKNNTIVDISGGQILNIYVKDDFNTYRNVREYINMLREEIGDIANGRIGVGIALKAVADSLGNDIVNTYLTQTAGATKDFVRKYSLPREFNDIFYISKDGYSKEVPTDVAPQFSVETNNIGDFTLFDVIKTNDCEYELSRKNSADNAIYISASRDCIVTFRLSTQARNAGQDWVDLDVELSNSISMTPGQLQRVDFSSIFTYLGEKVLDLKVGDMLRQTLEVVMQETTPTTFNVYSNETYPSIFNINTLSQVVYHTSGKLGEQPVFKLTPNGAITASGVALSGSDFAQLYNNVECQVVINIPTTTQGYELFNENMSILGVELGGHSVRLATPYNFESGVATFKDLGQVAHSQDAVKGITYTMKCFIKISVGGDVTFLVDEDNLDVVHDYPAITFAESERQKSKNLFNINKLSFGYTSGSWSINYNTGTITFVNSGANSTSELRLKDFTDLKAGKTYKLSYAYTGTPTNLFIYLNGSDSTWPNGNIHTITQAELDSGIHMYGSNTGTVTLSDIIMVEDGVDIDYQPYHGQISHTGNKEIEFARNEYEKSKNLLYMLNGSRTELGLTWSINEENQTLTYNGTLTAVSEANTGYIKPIKLKAGKTYTYSITIVSGTTQIGSISLYNTQIGRFEKLFIANTSTYKSTKTMTEDIVYDAIRIYGEAGNVSNNCEIRLQIEENNDATEWQYPYGAIVHEKRLNEIVNGKYPIDINACTTYDEVYNLLQNATCGQCGIGVNHTNAIKSLLPTFPTNASYVDCIANIIKNKYTASVNLYAIRFTGCPFGVNQPIYYCDVFYDGENTTVTGWYKPETVELIYDKSSSDANINKGKTSGVQFSEDRTGYISIENAPNSKYDGFNVYVYAVNQTLKVYVPVNKAKNDNICRTSFAGQNEAVNFDNILFGSLEYVYGTLYAINIRDKAVQGINNYQNNSDYYVSKIEGVL